MDNNIINVICDSNHWLMWRCIRWKVIIFLYKGLKPVLEGFVVTMHQGTCKQEVHSWSSSAQARVHCDNKNPTNQLVTHHLMYMVQKEQFSLYVSIKIFLCMYICKIWFNLFAQLIWVWWESFVCRFATSNNGQYISKQLIHGANNPTRFYSTLFAPSLPWQPVSFPAMWLMWLSN